MNSGKLPKFPQRENGKEVPIVSVATLSRDMVIVSDDAVMSRSLRRYPWGYKRHILGRENKAARMKLLMVLMLLIELAP